MHGILTTTRISKQICFPTNAETYFVSKVWFLCKHCFLVYRPLGINEAKKQCSHANDSIPFLDYPQCRPSVYRTLDEPSRDLRKSRDSLSVLCDTELPRAWYRFKLDGQPAQLPTVCPPSNACGTSSPVWLPKADGIELGKQVEIKACASWTIGSRRICCFWKLSVYVRHCGDFKVYRLRRTDFCPIAYCADGKWTCDPDAPRSASTCEKPSPEPKTWPRVLRS